MPYLAHDTDFQFSSVHSINKVLSSSFQTTNYCNLAEKNQLQCDLRENRTM